MPNILLLTPSEMGKERFIGDPNTKIIVEYLHRNGGKYWWIQLENGRIRAIGERNVCAKFEDTRLNAGRDKFV